MKLILSLITALAIMLSSCTPVPMPVPSASPSPSVPLFLPFSLPGYVQAWDSHLSAGFKNLDMTPYCPKWASVDHARIWQKFWVVIMDHESSFDPADTYTETKMGIDPITHKQVVSAGLLQLSYQDVKNYHAYTSDCDPMGYDINPKNIFNPAINLKCGMAIANRLLSTKRSLGAYWSTAQAGSSAMKDFKKYSPECF